MKSPKSDTPPTDCDLRPGGMLVQKREAESGSEGPTIKIRVSHGSNIHDVFLPAQSTFGELKRILAREIGIEVQDQRLLFRGKEKDNEEFLHMAGVKDMSKMVLYEDPSSKERKVEEMRKDEEIARERKVEQMKRDEETVRVREAVSRVSSEVDKLSERVSALEAAVLGGTRVVEKEFDVATELLMTQLLKLDGVKAEGEAKMYRKNEVRRIQGLVDTLDALKVRNSNPVSNSNDAAASVTPQWEKFESGMGSLTAPRAVPSSTAKEDEGDWERFE